MRAEWRRYYQDIDILMSDHEPAVNDTNTKKEVKMENVKLIRNP